MVSARKNTFSVMALGITGNGGVSGMNKDKKNFYKGFVSGRSLLPFHCGAKLLKTLNTQTMRFECQMTAGYGRV